MRKSVFSVRVLSVFLSLFLLTGMFYSFGVRDSVQAAASNYSVSLTAAQSWIRPSPVMAPLTYTVPFSSVTPGASTSTCYYAVTIFRTDTDGVYSFDCTANSASDPMFYLYTGSFDPVNAIGTNFLIGIDDRAGNTRPYMNVPLTAGTTYYLVTTTFSANISGTVAFTIDGPGNIINPYKYNYSAGAGGTISGAAQQSVFSGESGTAVEAVPNTGHHFLSWSDPVTSAARTDANAAADLSVTANFEINSYSVHYASGANGSVTGDLDQTITHGSVAATVEAVPSPGYHFVSWSDGSLTALRTDTVTANIDVSASFARNTYTAKYGTDGNGTISGSADQTVIEGENAASVEAVANTGYHFLSWSDTYSAAIRTDLAMTANIDVTANFEINSYTATYTAGANGSVTGDLDQTVTHGSDAATVEAVPITGYHFVSWSDGSTNASRTDTVTGVLAVSASFARNTYTAAYGTDGNGTITGDNSQDILYGDNAVEVVATPNIGYHFLSWSDGYPTPIRTDLAVADNIDVTVNFEINTYSATYTAGSFGSLNGDPDQSITHGSDAAAVEAVPDTGCHFVRWSDGVLTTVRTDLALTGDLTVEAIFAIDLFDVSFQTQGGSAVTPAVVPYLNLAASPAAPTMAGHTFAGWYKEAVCTHAWDFAADTVTADTILYAKWTINSYTVSFYDWDGSVLGMQLIRFGDDAVAPAAPLRSGYIFVSWSEAFDNVADNTMVEAVYRLIPTPTPTAVPTAVPTAGVLGAGLTATPTAAAVLGAAKTGETNNQTGMIVGIVLLLGFGAVTTVYVIRKKKMKE